MRNERSYHRETIEYAREIEEEENIGRSSTKVKGALHSGDQKNRRWRAAKYVHKCVHVKSIIQFHNYFHSSLVSSVAFSCLFAQCVIYGNANVACFSSPEAAFGKRERKAVHNQL